MGDLERIADVAKTGSSRSAVCIDCGKTFEAAPQTVTFGSKVRELPLVRCPDCAEALWRKDDAEARQMAFASMMSAYRDHDRGSRLESAAFENFQEGPHNATALATALEWLETPSPRPNLIISGIIGSGKTYLAACLYNALLARLEVCYWVNAATLMAQIRRGMSDRELAQEAHLRLDKAGHAPILVFDDLGKVHPGRDVSWVEETFYAIIDERYRCLLPTVVTTEWDRSGLTERVGASVASRLMDGAVVAGIKKPERPYRHLGGVGHDLPGRERGA